jgi:hypothetical protein
MWAIVRNIACKKCGFRGMAEDQGPDEVPVRRIFKHLGKTAKGHLLFRCPSCNTVSPYSPYRFFHPAIKQTFFVILVLIIVVLAKWIMAKV